MPGIPTRLTEKMIDAVYALNIPVVRNHDLAEEDLQAIYEALMIAIWEEQNLPVRDA